MKAGTQLVSTQSWSLKLEQGHVVAMLKVVVLCGICTHPAEVWKFGAMIDKQCNKVYCSSGTVQ